MPRLSVLMPAFNAATTIKSAVKSTLRAMPRDAELIVGDDASTDATLATLDLVLDRRLRVVRNDSNIGVAATLNGLLSASDSEFVGRMDADDISLPWRFTTTLRALTVDADVAFAPVVVFQEGKIPRPQRPVGLPPSVAKIALSLGNPYVHSTMVAKRSALNLAHGYRPVPSEDYDLWMRLAADGAAIRKLRTPVLLYRRHAGQVTANELWRNHSIDNVDTAMAHTALLQSMGVDAPSSFSALRTPGRSPCVDRLLDELDTHISSITVPSARIAAEREVTLARRRQENR